MHPGIKKYFVFQLILGVFLILLMLITMGKQGGFSAFTAMMCYVLPNLLFVRRLFRHRGAQAAKQIVKNFYHGEALKLFSTMIMMALAFIWLPIRPSAFFITFVVLQFSIWVAPFFVDKNRTKGQ